MSELPLDLLTTTAAYSTSQQVPVYEYNIAGNHVMRRRSDDWINATHILKVADYDKPARTRILEREVQKGTHEKVQGGYGKYQGTHTSLAFRPTLASSLTVCNSKALGYRFMRGDYLQKEVDAWIGCCPSSTSSREIAAHHPHLST